MAAYGRDFLGGWPVLVLLILATVISSTAAVIGHAITSIDKMWWGFGLNSIWSLVLLAGAALLVPRYGALGLAGAYFASYLVHVFTISAYVRVYLRSHPADPEPARCGRENRQMSAHVGPLPDGINDAIRAPIVREGLLHGRTVVACLADAAGADRLD
jgi:hypothetical protein